MAPQISLLHKTNPDHMPWIASPKLTADDFYIKTKSLETTASFAQFYVEYQLSGSVFILKTLIKMHKIASSG
jgi:hypothetical protein